MKLLIGFVSYLMWVSLALTIFGLFRPWLALWWTDFANRKKVLQYYGGMCLLLIVVYILLIIKV